MRQPIPDRAGGPWVKREALILGRAIQNFWRHGDLFSGAAISFYALFSLLPLTLLLLVGLQMIFSSERIMRNMGRLFGLTDTDLILRTVQAAYAQTGSFGWLETITLILAAAGVFGAVQVALDRVWESRGRIFHVRFLIGILSMAGSLLIFLGTLVATATAFRLIRTSGLEGWLGWPVRLPSRAAPRWGSWPCSPSLESSGWGTGFCPAFRSGGAMRCPARCLPPRCGRRSPACSAGTWGRWWTTPPSTTRSAPSWRSSFGCMG